MCVCVYVLGCPSSPCGVGRVSVCGLPFRLIFLSHMAFITHKLQIEFLSNREISSGPDFSTAELTRY